MAVEAEGRSLRAVALGPVAAMPPFQRAGGGSALIEGALAIARATGEEIVFVLGGHYPDELAENVPSPAASRLSLSRGGERGSVIRRRLRPA